MISHKQRRIDATASVVVKLFGERLHTHEEHDARFGANVGDGRHSVRSFVKHQIRRHQIGEVFFDKFLQKSVKDVLGRSFFGGNKAQIGADFADVFDDVVQNAAQEFVGRRSFGQNLFQGEFFGVDDFADRHVAESRQRVQSGQGSRR